MSWFRHQYPHLIMFAIPNGGRRNAREAAIMKAEGVLAGIPDMMLALPNGKYGGLFIEMKAGKGRNSSAQDQMQKMLVGVGYCVVICRSFEEFQITVRNYVANG